MNTFNEDLEVGIAVEQKLVNILLKKYPSTTLVTKFKGYDIWIPELHKSIEVKFDEKSKQTGNIVIEIEMYDKPSGLLSTTADYWVFYDGDKFISITPKDIIKCIFLLKLNFVEFVGNGDTVKKKAFLVPKDKLFNYGKEFN